MYSVNKNWERLVRATLKQEQLKNAGQTSSGIAGAVPASLGKTTNIDLVLLAADELQDENLNISRILCEQAYTMAHNLDPNSDGRGVLQFRAGLMSVIKQKRVKMDGSRIDRNRDVEQLCKFYQQYKRRHRVDDMQKEALRDFETSGANLAEMEIRSSKMKKVFANLRALIEVMESRSRDSPSDGVGRDIKEELRRIRRSDAALTAELIPYNIAPMETPSLTNAIEFFPEEEIEETYIMVKPDGVQRGLVGEIISRFEKKGLKLTGLKLFQCPQELAEEHYKDVKSRSFFPKLINYITSGPVVCMAWEGIGVVASARKLIGSSNPLDALPGTIRGDLAVQTGRNVIHGSYSPENGKREIALWFKEGEVCEWTPAVTPWLTE